MTDRSGNQVNIAGSLRNTLMVSLIGGAVVLAVIIYLVVRAYAAQIAQSTQDRILSTSVTLILDAAAIRNDTLAVELPYSAFSILSTQADDRFFYAVHQDGAFLSGYERMVFTDTPAGEMRFYDGRFDGSALRIATGSRRLVGSNQQSTLTVTVAQSQEHLAEVLNRISRNAGLLGFGFFALMTLLSLWLTYATITPLTRLAASVQRRGPEDLRPVAAPVPAEMAPLVTSLNNLMARLAHSLTQSEEFIAEAAHRVRTPLATVRSYAETTLQRVDKLENRQALRSMVRAIDESSRAAGQLLDHAMITFRADHLNTSHLDLAELTRDLVQAMRPLAEMKDVDLELTVQEETWVEGDAILLQNALRNLIDNALKYAPFETAIEVAVETAPARVFIRDFGPGFPAEDLHELHLRFRRGSNSDGIIGSGLGLTIAHDVAAAHGGSLTLFNPVEGGACAILSL